MEEDGGDPGGRKLRHTAVLSSFVSCAHVSDPAGDSPEPPEMGHCPRQQTE